MLRGYLGFLALVWAGIGLVLLVMPEALEGYAGVRAESGVAKAEYDRLPGFIQEGMLRLRNAYGAGYFSRFSRAFFLDEADKTSLTRLAPDMAVARTPVLLLVGGADRCIDPHKCEQVHRQFGPQWCERRSLEGYGHFGAPLSAGRTSMRPIELNILTRSAVHAAQWLSFGAGRGTSPTARL